MRFNIFNIFNVFDNSRGNRTSSCRGNRQSFSYRDAYSAWIEARDKEF